ncbi:MAG: hypothetical protein KAX49_11380 [Halanaerobiales bacterium]|nr:hypothetical protein [Halanaerobiales bacterium]
MKIKFIFITTEKENYEKEIFKEQLENMVQDIFDGRDDLEENYLNLFNKEKLSEINNKDWTTFSKGASELPATYALLRGGGFLLQ